MGDYYIGEIRLFPYNKVPTDWHIADGTLMNISNNAALYSLLGTQFGGDGRTTFALPNLQGRVVVGKANAYLNNTPLTVGASAGADTVVLDTTQIPPHTHQTYGTAANGSAASPQNGYFGTPIRPATAPTTAPAAPTPYIAFQNPPTQPLALNGFMVAPAGTSQAHENRQPYLALVYAIAVSGIYPPRP